jgi:5-methylcytosine-specific restriction endonuclease McrA
MSVALQQHVLLLNRDFGVLRVINAKKAFVLLCKGAAEAIEVEENKAFAGYDFDSWTELSEFKEEFEPDNNYMWVATVRKKIVVPTVIRLLTYTKFKMPKVRFNRRNLYMRDNYTCQYCGVKKPSSELNLDHVIPQSKGGQTSWENVVCSCIKCNTKKGAKTPKQAGMELLKKPVRLRTSPELAQIERHPDWDAFVSAAYWNTELKG